MDYNDRLDPTSEEGVEKMKQHAERERTQYLMDLLAVIQAPQGRRFLQKLTKSCFMRETTFDRSNAAFARNEGRRSVMLDLNYDLGELVVRRLIPKEDLLPFFINLEESDG